MFGGKTYWGRFLAEEFFFIQKMFLVENLESLIVDVSENRDM